MTASNRLMGPVRARKQKFQQVQLLSKNLLEKLFSERVSEQLPQNPPTGPPVRVRDSFRAGGNFPRGELP